MSDSMSPSPTELRGPFRSLLAAWTVVVVVLAVAGFSASWSYYYNFGLQSIVLEAPLSSLPVHAIEIIRNPQNFVELIELVFVVLVPFELFRLLVHWAVEIAKRKWLKPSETTVQINPSRFQSGIVLDAMRAGLLVYIALVIGGDAGHRDYVINVVDTTSQLPIVAAVLPERDGNQNVARILCDTRPIASRPAYVSPKFVGSPVIVRYLSGGAACSSPPRAWRLLYRDEKFIYLFATVPQASTRPDTIVLPHSEAITLILR